MKANIEEKKQLQQQRQRQQQPLKEDSSPAVPTATATKPIKKSSTSLLCELTRLKSQQKYLECNQVKLNPNNFLDNDDNHDSSSSNCRILTSSRSASASSSSSSKTTNTTTDDAFNKSNTYTKKGQKQSQSQTQTQSVTNLINEIEYLKVNLGEKLHLYRQEKRDELQDMWRCIHAIKDDVFRPERLNQFSMQTLRERIISVNKQLERLAVKNANDLHKLQQEYETMEKDNKIIWK